MTVIALDAMGGDFAPAVTVQGAVLAAGRGLEVALVGDAEVLGHELNRLTEVPSGIRLVHASDAIGMDEHAAMEARGRRQSSIYVAMELVKRDEAQAFVSLGNTGAVLALALIVLGRIRGVERPGLGALIPRAGGPVMLLDVGANAQSRASHLVQFARLGVEYMRGVLDIAEPRVGLLNIGEEATKGAQLTVEAHHALQASGLRFEGNVEGRDIVAGSMDVIVTDGFTGNVVLKAVEGAFNTLMAEMETASRSSWRSRLGGLLLRPALLEVRARFDYRTYGGVPLLGVEGIVIVGHGRSDAETVANAVATAATAVEQGVLDAMRSAVAEERSG